MKDSAEHSKTKDSTKNWRDDVKDFLHDATLEVEEVFEKGRARVRRLLPYKHETYILPYRGYANASTVYVSGRVLRQKPAVGPADRKSLWENLLDTYRRWESDEVPDQPVTLVLGNQRFETRSDEEGYVHFAAELDAPLPGTGLWRYGKMVVSAAEDLSFDKDSGELSTDQPGVAPVHIQAPGDAATFGVISDVDDTVLHTDITNLVTAAKITFLGNAETRQPLDGVPILYSGFQRGPEGELRENPIFYVSSSAWNLYDLLEDFLELKKIPLGPILLRDLGVDENKFIASSHDHKLEKAIRIVDAFPHLPFVAIGDSGQQDARIYAELVAARPGRVKAVYIRDVVPGREDKREAFVTRYRDQVTDAGVPFRLVESSGEIASHALGLGLVAPDVLDALRATGKDDG